MEESELRDLVSSCIKKTRYKSEQIANETINRVHKKRNTPLRVYFCKHCLGWHITSKPLKIKRGVKNVRIKSRKINKSRYTKKSISN